MKERYLYMYWVSLSDTAGTVRACVDTKGYGSFREFTRHCVYVYQKNEEKQTSFVCPSSECAIKRKADPYFRDRVLSLWHPIPGGEGLVAGMCQNCGMIVDWKRSTVFEMVKTSIPKGKKMFRLPPL